jgi:hypothetical protein
MKELQPIGAVERVTLTEREFAAAVGLGIDNVRALRRGGRVSHCRINGRVVYLPTDVEKFLSANRVEAVA